MDKIQEMTPEQEQQMVEFREEYLQIGLSTEPANRELAEQAIQSIRSKAHKECSSFMWFDGIATAELFLNIGANLWDNLGDNLWANLSDNLGANLGDNLWANLRANLRANLWANLGDTLWANLSDNLGDNLWDNLGSNLGANLRDNLRDNLGSNLGANLRLHSQLEGQMEYWIAWYMFPHKFLRNIHSDSDMEHLNEWDSVFRSCCWWWPYENTTIVAERPASIVRNEEGLLHNESGPAISWRDGWEHFALEGVNLDRQIVMAPESQSVQQLESEENEEVRRIRIERFGVLRYLEESNSSVVDTRRNDIEATFEILANTPNGQRLVTHCPSTGRRYFLSIPEQVETCEQAQAVLWDDHDMRIIGRT